MKRSGFMQPNLAYGFTSANGKPMGRLAIFLMICLYNLAMIMGSFLLLPLIFALSIHLKKRLQTFRHRLWWPTIPPLSDSCKGEQSFWIHALSVGEVLAAQSLVRQLRLRYPEIPLVFTASTLTGYQTACRIFGSTGMRVSYFPYDLILSVRSAASQINPLAVILVETDIWPNFLFEMKRRNVPVYLVNFRFSEKTYRLYRRFAWIAVSIFRAFEKICVQTQRDARRIESLGVDSNRIFTTGNIKFDDMRAPQVDRVARKWREKLKISANRQVIVAGSTHEGEETILFDAFDRLQRSGSVPLLVVAPRDPDRSEHILTLCRHQRVFLSSGSPIPDCGLTS
jgi:3-deoxy-D-manno-octulosonic-acid transferase